MIYLFYGNSEYLLEQQISSWKKQFRAKYDDSQLLHIKTLGSYEQKSLNQELLGQSLFSQKRLIIIDGVPLNSGIKDADLSSKQDVFLEIVEKIPEENIIIFSSHNPDKRGKFFKFLEKQALDIPEIYQVKKFDLQDENDALKIIKSKYGDVVDIKAISTLLQYKGGRIVQASSEIEKLLISHQRIDEALVKQHITPVGDESIFQFLNDLLVKDSTNAYQKMQSILLQSEIMSFYYALVANLRTIVYIVLMSHAGQSQKKIAEQLKLGKRQFLVQKYEKLQLGFVTFLYEQFLEADKKMKMGKLSHISKTPMKDELESIILLMEPPA